MWCSDCSLNLVQNLFRRQHIGNKKSDSPYPMENTDNQNTQYHIAHTKLFKSSFAGASGNEFCSEKLSYCSVSSNNCFSEADKKSNNDTIKGLSHSAKSGQHPQASRGGESPQTSRAGVYLKLYRSARAGRKAPLLCRVGFCLKFYQSARASKVNNKQNG